MIKDKLAILLIVNHYRAYIFATSPQLWAGDEYWTSAAPRSNILSPSKNFSLVTNIQLQLYANKPYIYEIRTCLSRCFVNHFMTCFNNVNSSELFAMEYKFSFVS